MSTSDSTNDFTLDREHHYLSISTFLLSIYKHACKKSLVGCLIAVLTVALEWEFSFIRLETLSDRFLIVSNKHAGRLLISTIGPLGWSYQLLQRCCHELH